MRIVRADIRHLNGIDRIEKLCFSCPWSKSSLSFSVTSADCLTLAAVDDSGEVIGYIGTQNVLDEATINNIAVDPAFRRTGVAKALINEFFTRSDGISRVFLDVRESNIPARVLYESFGFEVIARRKGYYVRPDEDALVMRKVKYGSSWH